ncbi:MAG: ABC transporter substrate-binding protein [Acidilobaceae archaeon]
MSNRITSISLILLLVLLISIAPIPAVAQTVKGPASDRIVITRVPHDRVASALEAREIDMYIFGLRGVAAAEIAKIPGVKLAFAPTGLIDIVLNPAPVQIVSLAGSHTEETVALTLGVKPTLIRYVRYDEAVNRTRVELCGVLTTLPSGVVEEWRHPSITLNPFCIREVRFALNYALDRDKIVREVYHGFALIKYMPYGPDDPTYAEVADVAARYRFGYNPDYAKKVITEIMTDIGATLVGGVWHYADVPVEIKALIRVEDERLDIGRAFALELIKLGFKVSRLELPFGPAISTVYYTDPKELRWSYYTEGWGKGVMDRYDAGPLAQFGGDFYCYLPGWCEPGYWNYKHELTIDGKNASDYARMAVLMKVKSKEEWVDSIRKGLDLAVRESIRIWGFARLDITAYRDEVRGLTLDLGAGLRSPFNCRGAHIPGREELKVGHLWVHTATTIWNPYRGFRDVYSVDPARCTYDFSTWRHPFTGMPMPFRVSIVSIDTAGPEGKLQVPDDAIWFDAVKNTWVSAKDLGRTTATSKVVFDYSKFLGAKWHNGQTITWADIIGGLGVFLDAIYDDEKAEIEPTVRAYYKDVYDVLVALRIIGETRLEVYLNYWHFEPLYIADWAALGVMLPFELYAVQDYAAFVAKEFALDRPRADRERIPWLSLALKDHAERLTALLEEIPFASYESYVTIPGRKLMTETEWRARVAAARSWFEEYRNLWISNGPFMLTEYNVELQRLTLTAFRDPTYPFGPTDWVFGEAVTARVTGVETRLLVIGRDSEIAVRITGPGTITVKYLISDLTTGEVLATGAVTAREGLVTIKVPAEVTTKLVGFAGYRLTLITYSDVVALPSEYSTLVQAVPAQFVEQYEELAKSLETLRESLMDVETRIGAISRELADAIARLGSSLSESIATLGSTLNTAIEGLRTATSATISETRGELRNEVQDVRSVAEAARSYAMYALILSAVNMLLILAMLALFFRRS